MEGHDLAQGPPDGHCTVSLPWASHVNGSCWLKVLLATRTELSCAFLGPWQESRWLDSWGQAVGPGLGPCQGSTSRGSCGLAWSSGFLLGHWAGGPLPSTGSSPAAPHCRWLGQVLAEVSWHRRLGLGSKAGIMPALDAIPAGGRALCPGADMPPVGTVSNDTRDAGLWPRQSCTGRPVHLCILASVELHTGHRACGSAEATAG